MLLKVFRIQTEGSSDISASSVRVESRITQAEIQERQEQKSII